MERDYQKDLEVCEKATPEPWVWNTMGDLVHRKSDGTDIEVIGIEHYDGPQIAMTEENDDFVTTARTALPFYIKRCMEQDDEISSLRNWGKGRLVNNTNLRTQLGQAQEMEAALRQALKYEAMYHGKNCTCKACQALSAPAQPSRYREALAVVEALKELTQACKKLPASDGRAIGLIPIIDRAENALAAYDKTGEGAG